MGVGVERETVPSAERAEAVGAPVLLSVLLVLRLVWARGAGRKEGGG